MAIFSIYYIKRAATPKVGKQDLSFLCSARWLMMLYIFEKFHNISNGFATYRADKSTLYCTFNIEHSHFYKVFVCVEVLRPS